MCVVCVRTPVQQTEACPEGVWNRIHIPWACTDVYRVSSSGHGSRWFRRFVLLGAVFLVLWQLAVLLELSHRTAVVLGLFGFVFHTIFGKAYSLVPSYFDRTLATTRLLAVHLVLTASGTILLALAPELAHPAIGPAGALAWSGGVLIFLGTLGWTIRSNISGAATATGGPNEHRRRVDRLANLFVPVALAYLAVGSYELLAIETALPLVFDGYRPRASHLLAAGTGAVLVFALGFRLLPRFLVATPPWPLVAIVLPAGALAPAILARGLPDGTVFQVGAILQSVAIAGFAVAFWILYHRSDRHRVGFYGVLASTVGGLLAVALGLHFAFATPDPDLVAAHRRLTLLGFLGLAIVGVSYQFYPPGIATVRGGGDRTALVAIVLLFGGVVCETIGHALTAGAIVLAGQSGALAGAVLHLFLLATLFQQRFG